MQPCVHLYSAVIYLLQANFVAIPFQSASLHLGMLQLRTSAALQVAQDLFRSEQYIADGLGVSQGCRCCTALLQLDGPRYRHLW